MLRKSLLCLIALSFAYMGYGQYAPAPYQSVNPNAQGQLNMPAAPNYTQPAPTFAQPSPDSMVPQAPMQPGQVNWFTNYNEAAQFAKQQNKPILLFFTGSDWCGWCKKMETEIFSTQDFAKLAADRFVFVEIDFPTNKTLPQPLADQNSQLKQKYGITGYPTIVILDSAGNFVAESGYRPGGGEAYAKYLLSLVQ